MSDRARSLFSDLARVPVPVRAVFPVNGQAVLTSTLRDTVANKKRVLARTVFLPQQANGSEVAHASAGPAVEEEGLVRDAYFADGASVGLPGVAVRAVLRSVPDGSARKRTFELWTAETGELVASANVTDQHGEFYADDFIGGLSWAASGAQLVYVAEAKQRKGAKFEDFEYEPDFGELYAGKRPPVLVVVRISHTDDEVVLDASVVDLEDRGISPSKPVFVEGGETTIVFVGHERSPKVWGIAACPNRPMRLYSVRVPLKAEPPLSVQPLTPADISARSPIPSHDGQRILFLSVPIGGPHASCSTLHELTVSMGKLRTVVAAVHTPATATAFPGLFTDSLSANGASYGDHVYLTTAWRSERAVVRVQIAEGTVTRIRTGDDTTAVIGVDPFTGAIAVAVSAIYAPPKAQVWTVAEDGRVASIVEIPSAAVSSPRARAVLASTCSELVSLSSTLEAIVVRRRDVAKNGPLVIIPHGGPHTAYANEWHDVMGPQAVSLVASGYTAAYVNYTGSTGFGNESIEALIGKIGDLEVRESHQVAVELLKREDLQLDPKNVFFLGGSHSGLIGTFIAAQYPGFYRAVVIRNPVTNVGAFPGTDILDWAFAEAGIEHDLRRPGLISPEVYSKQWAMSGTSVIRDVNTPTLVMLGAKDARVPPSQGLEWAAWLKGNKPEVPVRIWWFPDASHGLDSMDASRFGFEATVAFFEEFRK
ncbi:Alpha/Beta hydrolase protein [Blastocladiella britannica]|nr:Alpha/Beta hydrolase protein [Blastocladiella britannica]